MSETNRKEELHNIKKLSITGFLSEFGIHPVKVQGEKSWYKSLSRDENTASLCVYSKPFYDDWYDYGENQGGSIIDFVQKQMKMSYPDAMRLLRKCLE